MCLTVSYKVKHTQTLWSSSSTPRCWLQRNVNINPKRTICIRMFIATLFIITKHQKELNEDVDKWWYLLNTECCLLVRNELPVVILTMGTNFKSVEQKKPDTQGDTTWFRLQEIQEEVKLVCEVMEEGSLTGKRPRKRSRFMALLSITNTCQNASNKHTAVFILFYVIVF